MLITIANIYTADSVHIVLVKDQFIPKHNMYLILLNRQISKSIVKV